MRNLIRILLATVSMVCVSVYGNSHSIRDYYEEPGIDPFSNFEEDGFTEDVDPFSGMLRVNITDVMIPGNGGLDLRIGRSYGTPSMSTARSEERRVGKECRSGGV